MPSSLTTETRTLEQLLSGEAHYQIPDYQRAYSWTTKEAGQLIDDLMLARSEVDGSAESGAEFGYFLGAVLLMVLPAGMPSPAHGKTAANVAFDIVDGQQRLVTLTILLAVLRDVCRDRDSPVDSVIATMLDAKAGNGDSAHYRIKLRGREGRFLESYVQSPGSSADMPDEEDLTDGEARILAVREHLATVLFELETDELVAMARFLASACYFAVVTTRTIDRAHRIFSVLNERGRPLARNDILKAQLLGAIPLEIRPQFTASWDSMESRLGKAFEDLFSHVRTIEGRSNGTILSGIGAIVEAGGGAESFFKTSLEPNAAIFSTIRACGSGETALTPVIVNHLKFLSWLGSSEWIPPLMLYWRRCEGNPERLAAFLRRFDRLAFGMRLLGIGADKRVTRFNAVLHWVRDRKPLDGPDSPLELSREEQRNILYNLRGLHARSQLTCKLLLLRINDELAGAPQGFDPSALTVEHVLPQKPGRNSQWRTWFPLADDREACTQSLGNLILVTREQNDRARNMELARKLTVYFATPDEPPPHLTRELQGIAEWRRDQIVEREQRLLAIVHRLWQFDAGKGAGGSTQGEAAPNPGSSRRARRAAPREVN